MPEERNDVDGLIAAHLDGSLTEPQAQRLFTSLKADAGARRTLLTSAVQASILSREAIDGGERAAPAAPPRGARRRPAKQSRSWTPWLAVAAGLVAIVVP
jgi:hypothetical protein